MKFEVIRHFDKLGRIVIPIDFRKAFGITENTQVFISRNEEGIVLSVKDGRRFERKEEIITENKR